MVALTASDPDFGLNSRLTYSLLGEDAASFTIDPASGEVRTRWSLDREEQEQFLLVVRACDGGQDLSLSSSCLLTVLVEDENDNPPRLTNNPGSLTIPDNAGPGDFLYKLEVRDEDSGANSQLQYFLLGEAGRFSLDQNTGVLTSRLNVRNVGEIFSLEVSGRYIQYRIVAGDLEEHFTIDPNSGRLEYVKPLDREHMELFSL